MYVHESNNKVIVFKLDTLKTNTVINFLLKSYCNCSN